MKNLKQRLSSGPALLAPGAFDALSALLIERAGFEAAYISGASIAYTQLGRPDIGLVSLDHVADVIRRIAERVSIPLIVDADTGFGNALNVQRTVKMFERAGATAIQIEDQMMPKRCGHLTGKTLIPANEMKGKVYAALDARASADTLIIARTDAIQVDGFDAALARATLYAEAGADLVFVEAPESEEQMARLGRGLGAHVPLVANMVEGGKTPSFDLSQLSALGFRLVISPGSLVRTLIPAIEALLVQLKQHGSTRPFADHMIDLNGVNDRIGLAETLAQALVYDHNRPHAAE